MSSQLDDIWDMPAETATAPSASEHAQPLFMADPDDEEEQRAGPSQRQAPPPDIDAFFDLDDHDGDSDGQPGLSLAEMTKRATARHKAAAMANTPHMILPSSSPMKDSASKKTYGADKSNKSGVNADGKKPRKPIPRMDETRLLGETGFPALIKETKNFTPKGKGHEAADLNRLLQIYQFWTHRMYPKTQFKDTVERVEKLCHSRRMQISLSVWRDEAKGLVNGKPPGDPDVELASDAEDGVSPSRNPRSDPRTDPEEGYSSAQPSNPPSSSGAPITDDDDDWDIEAILRQEAAKHSGQSTLPGPPQASQPPSTYYAAGPQPDEDEDDFWADQDGFDDPPAQTKPAVPIADAEDDDLWNMAVDPEIPAVVRAPVPQPVVQPVVDEDDDMYG